MNKEQRHAFKKAVFDCLLKAGLLDSHEYSKAIGLFSGGRKENKATPPLNNVAIEPSKSDVCNEENEED